MFSLPTPPFSARVHSNGGFDGPGLAGVMLFSLTGYLTSAGTLCIVPSGWNTPGLGCLSSLPHYGYDQNISPGVGRDVWIAPWGQVGRVQEFVPGVGSSMAITEDERRWSREVLQYLEERGIDLDGDEEEWVRLEIYLPLEGDVPRLQTIVWPVSLCFIRLSDGDTWLSGASLLGTSNQDEAVARAESSPGNAFAINDAAKGTVALHQKLFGNSEYLALGGLKSSLLAEKNTLDDTGAIWFSQNAVDPVDFAEKWKLGAEERKQVIQARKEEREKERRELAEAEAMKKQAEELLSKEKEPKKEVDNIKREAATIASSVAGVYSTPPDGQIPTSAPPTVGFQENIPSEPTSAVSIDAGALQLSLPNDMDLDWSSSGDPMSLGGGDDAKNTAADLANFLGDDLVDGDEDIFATEVTDKDFEFFDQPAFADSLDGGMGLGDMGHGGDVNSGAMQVGHVSSLTVGDIMDLHSDASQMAALHNMDFGLERPGSSTGMDMQLSTPVLSKMELPSSTPAGQADNSAHIAEEATQHQKHIQTPPLSPQQAMRLLLPQYARKETPASNKNHPYNLYLDMEEVNSQSAQRKLSIYSPLVFLPNIEMADKKYMEGGRFFGPPPTEEKVDVLDGKLASITLLDSPLKRRLSNRKLLSTLGTNTVEQNSIHPPQPSEIVIEDVDDHRQHGDEDSSDSDYEYDENESSESDVDEESDEEFGIPVMMESSPGYIHGTKRKRALDDDGDLALMETGGDVGGATPMIAGSEMAGEELAPPPWQFMVPEPDDLPLADVFERLSVAKNDCPALSRMSDTEYISISKILVDQIINGTLLMPKRPGGLEVSVFDEDNDEDSLIRRRRTSGENRVEEVAKEVFGGVTRCTFSTYASIADTAIEPAQIPPGRGNLRPIAQPRRTQSGPIPTLGFDVPSPPQRSSSSCIFKIPPAHVHLHRAETALEISPVSLRFWETFGFGPCSGPKNVIGFCIYPAGEAMETAVDEFMERVGAAYDNCKLGSYVRGNLDDITAGMLGVQLPVRFGQELEMESIMQSIREACMKLGSMLANVADEMQNIVVYMVNPFSKPSALVDLCYAFYHLQQAYVAALGEIKYASANNIVLQIVPLDLVAAMNGLITPPQSEYIRFCLEVYNRCIPTDNVACTEEMSMAKVSSNAAAAAALSLREKTQKLIQQATFSPSIVLAKPPPKAINFQLAADPTQPLLHEGSCLHVAYKQSLDERWIVVAWTDNWGEVQCREAYCLGRLGCAVIKPWEDVVKDVWRRTMEFVKRKNMAQKVCVAKLGRWIDAEEVELWTSLANESTQPHTPASQPGPSSSVPLPNTPTTQLTILTVDPSPPLSLIPSLLPIAPLAFNPQSSLFTPATTPQPSTVSPDPSGSTASLNPNTGPSNSTGTPNADPSMPELDPDAQLVDYADEAWGVVLKHKLPVGAAVVEMRQGMASGYLVKRGAVGVEGGEEPIVMGVSVVGMVGANGSPGMAGMGGMGIGGRGKMAEETLKEVLECYRGLATLAQHKGVVTGGGGGRAGSGGRSGKGNVLPWHVAVVEKAVGGLEGCMPSREGMWYDAGEGGGWGRELGEEGLGYSLGDLIYYTDEKVVGARRRAL
ncbi:mediator complex subunit 13 C-terminal-domain-containing protein [Kalaharituber pfeilii]|nr:mediator complex subunit 13 C-terminal-domain-containing protein [Kalaharituber pfeilii]